MFSYCCIMLWKCFSLSLNRNVFLLSVHCSYVYAVLCMMHHGIRILQPLWIFQVICGVVLPCWTSLSIVACVCSLMNLWYNDIHEQLIICRMYYDFSQYVGDGYQTRLVECWVFVLLNCLLFQPSFVWGFQSPSVFYFSLICLGRHLSIWIFVEVKWAYQSSRIHFRDFVWLDKQHVWLTVTF